MLSPARRTRLFRTITAITGRRRPNECGAPPTLRRFRKAESSMARKVILDANVGNPLDARADERRADDAGVVPQTRS